MVETELVKKKGRSWMCGPKVGFYFRSLNTRCETLLWEKLSDLLFHKCYKQMWFPSPGEEFGMLKVEHQ